MQLLARHKDATTTLKHYIKCKDKAELAGVVSALPALMVSTPQNVNKKVAQEVAQNILVAQEVAKNLEALGYLESSQESQIENISETQVVDSSVVYGVLQGEIGSALDGNRTCNLRFRRTTKLRCKLIQKQNLCKTEMSVGLKAGLKLENFDPDLQFVIGAWSKLSLVDKKNITTIISTFACRKT